MKIIIFFYLNIFHFLVVKFSQYLNKRVFVMYKSFCIAEYNLFGLVYHTNCIQHEHGFPFVISNQN